MNEINNNRIKSLDGLRGVAVISVVAFHYINNQIPDGSWLITKFGKPALILQKITYFGWAGVNLFFILSGFLIGNILLRNKKSPGYFKTFYIRRFCRIVPAYYLLLVIFLLIENTRYFNPHAYIFDLPLPITSYFLFVQNFYMAWYNNFGPQALTPTWSLCVEEQFYVIIPLIVYFTNNRYVWILVAAGCIMAIISRHLSTNFYEGYVLLTSRIDSPMTGILLAWLHQKSSYRNWVSGHMNVIYLLLLIMTVCCGLLYVYSDPAIYGHTLLGILFGLIMTISLYSKKSMFLSVLSWPGLIQLGKYSYFIYLFHQFVNGFLHLVILKQLIPSIANYQSVWLTVASFVITYILAILSFKWLEKPFINFSHRFAY